MANQTDSNFLNRVPLLKECSHCKNSKQRQNEQDFDGYCNTKDVTDNLPIRCVGSWGKDKITFLRTYVDIVASAMKNKFSYINYIEICSGPGRCVDYETYDLFDGSPLAVMNCNNAKHISKYLFIDYDKKTIDILSKRVAVSKTIPNDLKNKAEFMLGDYNKPINLVKNIKEKIGIFNRTLSIVFIDPTNFEVPFDLYREIMKLSNVDFIINFPIGMDLNRNICNAISNLSYGAALSKYKKGVPYPEKLDSDEYISLANKNGYVELVELITNDIVLDFNQFGYKYSTFYNIRNYYKLFFFSKNPLGLKFWNEATKKNCTERESGQRFLF